MNKIKTLDCRVCGNKKTLKINLFKGLQIRRFSNYLARDNEWINIYCKSCNSFSHYPKSKSVLVKYADSSYRSDKKETKNPISLPWSTITSLRSKHIFNLLSKTNLEGYSLSRRSLIHLDYGGYNGFTAYALKSLLNIKSSIIADLDPNGLKIAKALGMKAFDLSKNSLLELENESIDFSTAVHVLEHLENPRKELLIIRKLLKNNGIIYVEVPNAFGTSLYDPAHLINFSINSINKLLIETGFRPIKYGYVSTPKDAIKFGHPFANPRENIFCIALKEEIMVKSNKSKLIVKQQNKENELSNSKIYIILKLLFSLVLYQVNTLFNYMSYLTSIFIEFLKAFFRIFLIPLIGIYFMILNIFNE